MTVLCTSGPSRSCRGECRTQGRGGRSRGSSSIPFLTRRCLRRVLTVAFRPFVHQVEPPKSDFRFQARDGSALSFWIADKIPNSVREDLTELLIVSPLSLLLVSSSSSFSLSFPPTLADQPFYAFFSTTVPRRQTRRARSSRLPTRRSKHLLRKVCSRRGSSQRPCNGLESATLALGACFRHFREVPQENGAGESESGLRETHHRRRKAVGLLRGEEFGSRDAVSGEEDQGESRRYEWSDSCG